MLTCITQGSLLKVSDFMYIRINQAMQLVKPGGDPGPAMVMLSRTLAQVLRYNIPNAVDES